jgi:hypothetical protein
MAVQIQLRNGSAAQWTSANSILAVGEMGVETDTNRFKIGTGTIAWNILGYSAGFAFKGAWSSGTSYVVNDVVSYNGSSYISIQNGTNQNPATQTAYWSIIALIGTSATQATTVYAYQWANTVPTVVNTAASFAWANSTTNAYPTNWTSTINSVPGTAYYLYRISKNISDVATNSNTVFEWNTTTGTTVETIAYTGTNGTNGSNGSNGISFIWKGTWSSGTSYAVNDVVFYNNSSYICTSSTSSTTSPDLLTGNWSLLVQSGSSNPTVTILNDISGQFDGSKTHFQLKNDDTPINIQADSKDFEVVIDGKRLTPYITRRTYPWLTPYDSFKGFRVRQFIDSSNVSSNSNYMTIYNAPYIGDSASVILTTPTSNTQIMRYPFSTTTIAFGD